MWRVTAGNGLPRCEGYRWARFGLLGSNFPKVGLTRETCFPRLPASYGCHTPLG